MNAVLSTRRGLTFPRKSLHISVFFRMFANKLNHNGDILGPDNLFPFRTEQLNVPEPMVLHFCGRVGRCQRIQVLETTLGL